MRIAEIIREQIRVQDMQGNVLTKLIISPALMVDLIKDMQSSDNFSDVATRLSGIEKVIDKNIPENEFRLQAKKANK